MPVKITILLIILFCFSVEAQTVQYNQEFQVNTYTSSHLYHPSVCGLIGGGFVVCWESYSENSDWSGILAQMFENNCTKRGEEFKANTDTLSSPIIPCISGLSDGGFVICWETESEYTERMGIFGQLFESSGSKRGEEFNINPVGEVNYSPSVCSLSDGIFVICWTSEGHDVDQSGIFAQMFENNGTKFGDELQVNTYTAGSQSLSSVSSISDGGFVVCWGSEGQDGSGFGVFLQIFDQNGNKRGSELQVNTYTNSNQRGAKISDLSDGQFVISWVSYRQDGSGYGIYGKYYLGTPIIHLLQSFSLISPAYDTTIYSTTVNFQWQKASPIHVNFPWELEYTLYLDLTEDFNDPAIFSGINDTTFSVKNLSPGQTYFWKVLAKTYEGDSLWSSETFGFYVSPAAGIEDDVEKKPGTFKLYDNYPNPFNPETTIRYSLPADQSSYQVIIKIYDVLGQLVITLRDAQQRPGLYHLIWNGRNAAGQAVPSGVYFCVLDAGSFKATQKMLLVR